MFRTSIKPLWKWFCVALLIKSIIFIFFLHEFNKNIPGFAENSRFAVMTFDTWSYILPVENLMNGKGYSAKTTERNYIPYSYRMPGFVPLYGPFYFFFGREKALTAFVLLQIIVDAVAVCLLSLTCFYLFKSETAFLLAFIVYSMSSFISIYNHYVLSESFSTSFIVFSIYFFVKAREENPTKNYFFSGMFITWAFLLRPITILYLCLFAFFTFIAKIYKIRQKKKYVLFFLLAFLVFEFFWCGRNFFHFRKFYPVSSMFSNWTDTTLKAEFIDYYSPQYMSLRKLITAVGGDIQRWGKNPEMKWFVSEKNNFEVPEIFLKFYPLLHADSLILIKQCYLKTSNRIAIAPEEQSCVEFTVNYVENFLTKYKQEKKMDFYFFSRLKHIKRFLFPRMIPDMPFPKYEKMNLYQKLVKSGYYVFFLAIVITGLIGVSTAFFKKKLLLMQVAIFPLSIIASLSLIGMEPRYFASVYPFFVIFSVFSILSIYNFLKDVKSHSLS